MQNLSVVALRTDWKWYWENSRPKSITAKLLCRKLRNALFTCRDDISTGTPETLHGPILMVFENVSNTDEAEEGRIPQTEIVLKPFFWISGQPNYQSEVKSCSMYHFSLSQSQERVGSWIGVFDQSSIESPYTSQTTHCSILLPVSRMAKWCNDRKRLARGAQESRLTWRKPVSSSPSDLYIHSIDPQYPTTSSPYSFIVKNSVLHRRRKTQSCFSRQPCTFLVVSRKTDCRTSC